MKKILILHFNMELGGAETSLLGLLDSVNYEQYEVDLFLYSKSGDLISEINEKVNILPEIKEYKALTESISRNFQSGLWKIGVARTFAKIRSRWSKTPLKLSHNYKQYFHKLCLPYLPKIEGDYDLAISFNDPHYIIGKKVNAKVKMSWFHTDASRLQFCDFIEKEMWGMSDYIVNVSEACKRAFDDKHPYLKEKSIVIENIISKRLIINKSLDSIEKKFKNNKTINLLSIGRFSYQKNFDNVPEICRLITEKGYNIKWYLIGYGDEEELIRQKIKDNKMDSHVIILGKEKNPYPYIKECDIYVQPSRFEGKCVAVREAQILCKPVVITNYVTANNQLEDKVDGVIVPMDNAGCADGIVNLINNKKLQDKLIFNLSKRDYTNVEEIKKIVKVIEGTQ